MFTSNTFIGWPSFCCDVYTDLPLLTVFAHTYCSPPKLIDCGCRRFVIGMTVAAGCGVATVGVAFAADEVAGNAATFGFIRMFVGTSEILLNVDDVVVVVVDAAAEAANILIGVVAGAQPALPTIAETGTVTMAGGAETGTIVGVSASADNS